ncbi:MAG TPA: gamma-glutamylcyclotransferase family protein [Anaerolineae bacterium]|jgi:gamma-glutamylcyclotransferase (GGCT)/AIG2-like uncharacterized protein YtfP
MEYLFVYGTLMDPPVQRMVFGRIVCGQPDTLSGYEKDQIDLGAGVYPIIRQKIGGTVEGLVITVTPAELKLIDDYEGSTYQRKKVELASGRQAWVYQA